MLTIRDFNNNNADYQACIEIWNANFGDTMPETVQQWQDRDRHFAKTHPITRLMGELEGHPVCYGQYAEESWAYQPGKYIWDFGIRPDSDHSQILPPLYAAILKQIVGKGAFKILVQARSDQQFRVDFIEAQGYQQIQREPTSWLDVTAFAPANFEQAIARINSNGIDSLWINKPIDGNPAALPGQGAIQIYWYDTGHSGDDMKEAIRQQTMFLKFACKILNSA